ncbi:hypothetical protein Pmani_000744 [Petrolisthes manimaculis]|uniref:Uncharacterized protein n=1 Tax=Petrolisthes manimaculis TaxID=1843537 RepID=A0AAE1UBW7_9EUCA|nr:hypothetical protein Pmani_013707 [Petrolisthes manimaculis]KAK4328853.1 hypothetical protein Pmani_000744 [Petrolisthes manimaculis]
MLKPLLMDSYLASPINLVLQRVRRAAYNVWPLVMILMLVVVMLGSQKVVYMGSTSKGARSLRRATVTVVTGSMEFVDYKEYKKLYIPMTLLKVLMVPMLVAVIMGDSTGSGDDEDDERALAKIMNRKKKDTQRKRYLRQMISGLLENFPQDPTSITIE